MKKLGSRATMIKVEYSRDCGLSDRTRLIHLYISFSPVYFIPVLHLCDPPKFLSIDHHRAAFFTGLRLNYPQVVPHCLSEASLRNSLPS